MYLKTMFDIPSESLPTSCPICKNDCYEFLFHFECSECGHEFKPKQEETNYEYNETNY